MMENKSESCITVMHLRGARGLTLLIFSQYQRAEILAPIYAKIEQ